MELSLKWTSIAIFVLSFAVWVGTSSVAQAHYLGHSAVDDCEIRYKDYTSYDTERLFAEAKWEGINGSNDCVEVLPDTWLTVNDLKWEDWYNTGVTWEGLYYYTPVGVDSIYMNTYVMANYSSCVTKNVGTHELGHAHGLQHSPSNDNYVYYTAQSHCGDLGSHETVDYEAIYGGS